MKNKKSNILFHLTNAALALPGLMQTASAGRVEETYNADFQYGNYVESKERMSVDIFEGAISIPIGKSLTASVNLVRDTISGASPIFNVRDEKGNINQVISGASKAAKTNPCGKSICEQRDALSTSLTYFFDKASLSLGGGFSREQDYMSKYFNTSASLDLNKKLTTLNFGASVAFDEITPSPSPWNTRSIDFNAHKTSQQYLLGVSQVIDKDSVIQSNMTFGQQSGFLSDPYKWVTFNGDADFGFFSIPLTNVAIQEKRPGNRFQWAWLTQYVRHFGQINDAALHADYRFFTDSWGINAHTFELAWHQPIADGWQVIPRFRYYSQDQADFYEPVFDGDLKVDPNTFEFTPKDNKVYSSDYRLAGFGTLSGGVKISKEFTEFKPLNQLKFQAGFEYYDHKAEYQLGGNNQGKFADFGYYLITASFNLKF